MSFLVSLHDGISGKNEKVPIWIGQKATWYSVTSKNVVLSSKLHSRGGRPKNLLTIRCFSNRFLPETNVCKRIYSYEAVWMRRKSDQFLNFWALGRKIRSCKNSRKRAGNDWFTHRMVSRGQRKKKNLKSFTEWGDIASRSWTKKWQFLKMAWFLRPLILAHSTAAITILRYTWHNTKQLLFFFIAIALFPTLFSLQTQKLILPFSGHTSLSPVIRARMTGYSPVIRARMTGKRDVWPETGKIGLWVCSEKGVGLRAMAIKTKVASFDARYGVG